MIVSALSPAKLNLFLHITGQRPDGYHTLQTVFQLLDYGDELTFTPRQDNQVILTGMPILFPTTDDNLILQAAQALQALIDKAGMISQGADIHITKRIPVGGGLGGGSSNAATTLIMLNKLWDLQLSTAKLAEIGLTLGADVPVFVWHASRSQQGEGWWAEGIGEQLQPIALPECWYVVITPPCAVSTQKIFSHSELTRATPPITIGAFLKGDVHNDCEPLVCKLYPEIARVINWLNQFSPTGRARLTGTGSSVFSAFDSETAARACLAQILPAWRGFVATSLR